MVLLLVGELILGPGCWNQVHPLVTAVPVDWEYTIPYGLIYAMDPPKELLQFLAVIEETGIETKNKPDSSRICRMTGKNSP